jgi:hypothetical protein
MMYFSEFAAIVVDIGKVDMSWEENPRFAQNEMSSAQGSVLAERSGVVRRHQAWFCRGDAEGCTFKILAILERINAIRVAVR